MNTELEELLKEIRAYRDNMVAWNSRNYPFQEINNIIIKWEKKKGKTVSEELQSELEPIKDYDEHDRDTSKDPFKGTSIEGKD